MRTVYIKPCPLLQPYIHSFVYTKTIEGSQPFLLDQHPTGFTSLGYYFGNSPVDVTDVVNQKQFRPTLNFTGQLKNYRPLQINSFAAVYAVFKPLGASWFLPTPLHTLTDNFTELSDLLSCKSVYEQLANSNDQPQQVIAILEQFLLDLLASKKSNISYKLAASLPRLSSIIKKMILQKGKMSMEDLCTDFNIPLRTLEVQFKNNIGISPKLFSRILRINHAYRQCIVLKKTDWQEIIHECNYFDQAHFIKEFKTFFGYTPSGMPAAKWNLSTELSGNDYRTPEISAQTQFANSILIGNKKNGSAAFATDPDIMIQQRDYLATLA